MRFLEASANARAALPFETLRYGAGERETVDVVAAGRPGAPLFFWIHGGYWRRMSKDDFSFVATPVAEAGAGVALVNYPLAPAATLDEIVNAVRSAFACVLDHAQRLGVDRARIVVGGHSVGAQLAGMLAADAPLAGLLGISGLYDLEPIRRSKINATIGMDLPAAARNSPLRCAPRVACPLLLACGEREQPEFHRQQREYAAFWHGCGGTVEAIDAPGDDHFSVVLQLAGTTSPLTRALLTLLARSAEGAPP